MWNLSTALFFAHKKLTLAPFLHKRLTISVFPAAAARHKGVMPLSVVPSTGAPISSSRATISTWPRWACTARIGAWPITSVHQEVLAPPSISRRLTCRVDMINITHKITVYDSIAACRWGHLDVRCVEVPQGGQRSRKTVRAAIYPHGL